MNVFNRIKKFFASNSSNNEAYSGNINDERFWNSFSIGKNASTSEVTYFMCLKLIGEAVAKLPLKLYKETESGAVKATDLNMYNKMKIRPNPYMSASSFWAAVQVLKYHYGNCYVYIHQNKNEAPDLHILDNLHMQIYDDNAKVISPHGDIWYVYTEPTTGKIYKFCSDEILHFKTLISFDGITGLSVYDTLSATVDASLKGQQFLDKLYESGLTGKVAVEYTADLSPGNKQKLVDTFESAIDGNKGLNFIPVPNGIKLSPLNIKLTDAQFLELRKYSAIQIAGAFGIKPNMINDYEKSSYANSESQQTAFYTDTLLAILKSDEEEINYKLMTEEQIKKGYFFKFNVDVILRADFATRMEGYAKARQNGWMSANDIRKKEDMPPIPAEEGGDAYLINGNMTPMELVLKGSDNG